MQRTKVRFHVEHDCAMKITLALLAIFLPLLARAEILVRHCDTPTAAACATTPTWVSPANAVNVQVNRTGAPFVALVTVLPTERIAACYDDPAVVAGSSTTCTKRVPNRNDLWQLKSVLYPVSVPTTTGSLQISVDASGPKWDSQAAISTDLLPDLYVRLYGAAQGQAKTLIDAAAWAPSLKFRRESASTAVFCYAASLALDTTGDKIPDIESAQTPELCGTHSTPPPVLKLLPPNGITMQSPAP